MYCNIEQGDYAEFLSCLNERAVDLMLTDPPYGISTKEKRFAGGVPRLSANNQDFGAWDYENIDLTRFARYSFRVLRDGGTLIVFYDFWKLSYLADALRAAGFSKLRSLTWEKTNPVPINSQVSYLTNAREWALSAVRGRNATFNSKYDKGVYHLPIPRFSGGRQHPTQKPVSLFAQLIEKHSNPGDMVADPFLGSGTTAVAARETGRNFVGCDIDDEYVAVAKGRIRTQGDLL